MATSHLDLGFPELIPEVSQAGIQQVTQSFSKQQKIRSDF